jgi:uncharacterized membrane protein
MADTLSRRFELARTALRFLLAAFYYLAGARHLTIPGDFAAMIPWLPAPHAVVIFTGWCELLGATGLLIPRLRKFTGVMLAIYAVCVYPANIYQAFAHVPLHGQVVGWSYHAPRLALQPVLVWWPLFCVKVINWPFRKVRARIPRERSIRPL